MYSHIDTTHISLGIWWRCILSWMGELQPTFCLGGNGPGDLSSSDVDIHWLKVIAVKSGGQMELS